MSAHVGLVNFPYISADKSQHGQVRYYYRRAGAKKRRVHGEPGTAEFQMNYDACRLGKEVDTPSSSIRMGPGTFGSMVREYCQSTSFKKLDESTQSTRQAILEKLIEKIGSHPADIVTPLAVEDAIEERGPGAGQTFFYTLRHLYKWARKKGRVVDDPTAGLKFHKAATDGFHSWTDEEIGMYEASWPVGSKQRLALGLALFTAQRSSDVVLLGPPMERLGRLRFTQQKNKTRRPVRVNIPIVPPLRDLLDNTETGKVTYLVTDYGEPFTIDGLRNAFRKWCDKAGLPHCSMHGLRKAAASRMAEHGCTELEIMAALGHTNPAQAALYTRKANRTMMSDEAFRKTFGEQIVPPKAAGGTNP